MGPSIKLLRMSGSKNKWSLLEMFDNSSLRKTKIVFLGSFLSFFCLVCLFLPIFPFRIIKLSRSLLRKLLCFVSDQLKCSFHWQWIVGFEDCSNLGVLLLCPWNNYARSVVSKFIIKSLTTLTSYNMTLNTITITIYESKHLLLFLQNILDVV